MVIKGYCNLIFGVFVLVLLLLLTGCQSTSSDDKTTDTNVQIRNLSISEAEWDEDKSKLIVKGEADRGNIVTIYDTSNGEKIGTAEVKSDGEWKFVLSDTDAIPCRLKIISDDDEEELDISDATGNCRNNASVPVNNEYQIFAVNDLGMHCMDGDYSVFSILPPFNNQHAQVINKAGKPVLMSPQSIEVRYSAIADASGSINSTSAGKTNFWAHVNSLFGASLPPDVGLTGAKMPSQNNGPQTFSEYDVQHKRYVAAGIPITPWDDYGQHNPYPLFRIEAVDKASGQVLTSIDSVVPVSEEMACADCHHTDSEAADDLTAARYGGVQWSNAVNAEVQYKENILSLHDAKHGTRLMDNQPVLCAQCHYSPALDLAGSGPQGEQTSVPFLSYAIHRRHGETLDGNLPATDREAIIGESGTESCYNCHPGKQTQCFRGAMADAGFGCQDCHGGMLAVGGAYALKNGNIRMPWIDLPKCQSCHVGDVMNNANGTIVRRVAYDPTDKAATPLLADNKRFAESDTTLYRFSSGHGGMDCMACHGSPHAIWPNANENANDNVAAKQIQGYVGTITECSSCHTEGSLQLTLNGPHGMHNVNDPRWSEDHGDFYEADPVSCQSCHGVNLEGTRLSRTVVDRNYIVDDDDQESIWVAKGTEVSCMLCHERPEEEDDDDDDEEDEDDEDD